MRATGFEFRYRFWLICLTYLVGFGSYAFDHMNSVEALVTFVFSRTDPHPDSLAARHALQALFTVSAMLVTGAAWIRTWGAAYLRTEVVHDSAVHTERLVADGPYRHLRNPLYLGNMLLAAGLAMLASRTGGVVLILGNLLIVLRLIGREEAALAQSQGEGYRAFLAAVPRLWPSLSPRLPASGLQARWFQAFWGEAWMWTFAVNGFLFAWKLNGRLYNIILGVFRSRVFSDVGRTRAFAPAEITALCAGSAIELERAQAPEGTWAKLRSAAVPAIGLPPEERNKPYSQDRHLRVRRRGFGYNPVVDDLENQDEAVGESRGKTLDPAKVAPKEGLKRFSHWQRAQISFASWAGFLANNLVGRTLRWDVSGWENWEAARQLGKGLIYTFWHREIFSATWFWRKRGIVVMTSQNFDGEIIARIILKQGYGAARGSSSRGAARALVEMVRCLRRGSDAAFTIDGPRGPRFVAKPGSVQLAKATGAAILCFHAAVRRALVFRKSWDLTEFPLPFTRAAMFVAPPIRVPQDADRAEQARKLQLVQSTLDELRSRAEEWQRS